MPRECRLTIKVFTIEPMRDKEADVESDYLRGGRATPRDARVLSRRKFVGFCTLHLRGRVAQMDRALASGAKGRGFESRSAHHEKTGEIG